MEIAGAAVILVCRGVGGILGAMAFGTLFGTAVGGIAGRSSAVTSLDPVHRWGIEWRCLSNRGLFSRI